MFLIEEIFMHYSSSKELLSDNSMNLKAQVVEYYLQKLATRHQNTTAYHSQINEKVKNLNSTLSDMLTKYLAGKSMKLWDKYLLQALFTMRKQVHVTHKKSSFYLLYSCHLFLPSDENSLRSLKLVILNKEHEKHITTLHTVNIKVNERLLVKAEHTQKI